MPEDGLEWFGSWLRFNKPKIYLNAKIKFLAFGGGGVGFSFLKIENIKFHTPKRIGAEIFEYNKILYSHHAGRCSVKKKPKYKNMAQSVEEEINRDKMDLKFGNI